MNMHDQTRNAWTNCVKLSEKRKKLYEIFVWRPHELYLVFQLIYRGSLNGVFNKATAVLNSILPCSTVSAFVPTWVQS